MKEPKKVRCIDCGMFAQRESGGIVLFTALEKYRTGTYPALPLHGDPYAHTDGICAMGHKYEIDMSLGENFHNHREEFRKIVAGQRICDDFCEWVPALLTPKEHLEMGLLADQRKWEASQNRWMIRATIIGGIVGGALSFLGGLVGAIVTYLVTRPPTTPPP